MASAPRALDDESVLAGGAPAAQQHLNASLADEGQLHLPPTMPGGGERLFDSAETCMAWYWSRRSRPPKRDPFEIRERIGASTVKLIRRAAVIAAEQPGTPATV